MFRCFLIPTGLAIVVLLLVSFVPIRREYFSAFPMRLQYISICIVKSLLWLLPYSALLIAFHVIDIKSLKK